MDVTLNIPALDKLLDVTCSGVGAVATSTTKATFLSPGPPVFAVRREPKIHKPSACTYL